MKNPSTATDEPRKVSASFFSKDDGTGLPHLDVSPLHILAHHPKRYMVMAGKLVPSPSRIPLVDGCNRVRVAQDGRIHFADTQAKLQDAGFKLIPFELGPDGESYLVEISTRPDGGKNVAKTVITVWEQAFPGERTTVVDEAGYASWLESLVENGKLPACPGHIAARMLETARASLKDAEDKKANGKLSDLTRIEALKAEIKVLEKHAERGKAVRGRAAAPDLTAPPPEKP